MSYPSEIYGWEKRRRPDNSGFKYGLHLKLVVLLLIKINEPKKKPRQFIREVRTNKHYKQGHGKKSIFANNQINVH